MKKVIRKIISYTVSFIPLPQKVRDFFMWPLASRVLGLSYTEAIKLKHGVWLYGSMHDILTRNILFLGEHKKNFWEPITTKIAMLLGAKARTAFIAGAHVGYDVFLVASVMQKGEVHTFEPVRELYELVLEGKKKNPTLPVVVNHMALSDRKGTVPIKSDTIRSMVVSEDEATEYTPSIGVVEYMQEKHISHLDLMLLDVEGHEMTVLKAMRNVLLKDDAPDIIYEVVLRGRDENAECISLMLEECGYRTFTILDDYHGDGGVPKEVAITEKDTKFSDGTRYLNVLATKKANEDIVKVGIKII